MNQVTLMDRIYGCMIGGAVGDAMGFPTEGMPYTLIRERWGKVREPRIREGAQDWNPPVNGPVYTDDTVMKHMVCQAIFKSEGRINIQAVADVWRTTIQDFEEWTWWLNTRVVAAKLKWNSLMPLQEVGRDSIPCNDAAMIVAPIGIVNAGDPEMAARETWNVSGLWQHGYSRECAAAMAACHAHALSPGATVDSVVETAKRYSPTLAPYIDKALALIDQCSGMDEFTERYYTSCLEFPNEDYWMGIGGGSPEWSFGADPLEVCTEALAFFKLANGDGRSAIIGGINFGRDCDTIAGIAGSLSGALNGYQTIPSEWIAAIVQANPSPDMMDYSSKLHDLLKLNMENARRRLDAMQ